MAAALERKTRAHNLMAGTDLMSNCRGKTPRTPAARVGLLKRPLALIAEHAKKPPHGYANDLQQQLSSTLEEAKRE
jgi:hypothetical protein